METLCDAGGDISSIVTKEWALSYPWLQNISSETDLSLLEGAIQSLDLNL